MKSTIWVDILIWMTIEHQHEKNILIKHITHSNMPSSEASSKKKQVSKSSTVETSKKAEKSSSSRRKTTAVSGGGIIDDVKALAVPFAILLAKQGLDSVLEKKPKEEVSSPSPEKPATKSNKRRGTMAGGQCGMCASASTAAITTPSMTGGAIASKRSNELSKKFNNIAKEIETFLNKY